MALAPLRPPAVVWPLRMAASIQLESHYASGWSPNACLRTWPLTAWFCAKRGAPGLDFETWDWESLGSTSRGRSPGPIPGLLYPRLILHFVFLSDAALCRREATQSGKESMDLRLPFRCSVGKPIVKFGSTWFGTDRGKARVEHQSECFGRALWSLEKWLERVSKTSFVTRARLAGVPGDRSSSLGWL